MLIENMDHITYLKVIHCISEQPVPILPLFETRRPICPQDGIQCVLGKRMRNYQMVSKMSVNSLLQTSYPYEGSRIQNWSPFK